VEDLIAAARIVKVSRPDIRVVLIGKRDDSDPDRADPAILDIATREKVVEIPGPTDDVRSVIAASDCAVLPSYYREGTPRSLLEAAAMAKPLIAADSVGTREPVTNGQNGYLCRPRDPDDLAAKMVAVAALPADRLTAMGVASRRLMEERFDERIVIRKYIEIVQRLVPIS
jgi:glycosyltransferase involved in cell wall biosynthesis